MATFNEGYKNIKVKLINWRGDKLAQQAYQFGRFGSDAYKIPARWSVESENNFVDELLNGTTFPKYVFERNTVDFEIEGISRICLAQLTRDNAIFCSESHGLRPLSQEFNIPLSITKYPDIMDKVKEAQKLLEQAYVACCEREVPYPESRYICLHSQTISLTASFTAASFVRSCYSRTNNSFCDELNYVYRMMYRCLDRAIDSLQDENSKKIWRWLIDEKKCIDDNYYKRTNVFNSDFLPSEITGEEKPAQNDWRKSGWKMELERIEDDDPDLLTIKELKEIYRWKTYADELLPTSYDETVPRVAKNAIKNMPYYKEAHDET